MWKLRLALASGWVDRDPRGELKRLFDELHRQTYGYDVPDEPVEIVNVGVSVTGRIRRPRLRIPERELHDGKRRAGGCRDVYFVEAPGFVSCEVVSRYSLEPGAVVAGPAVVEEKDSTTVVHPGYTATILEHGELLLAPAV